MPRILVLHNDDGGLAHGEERDRLAVEAVLDAVRGVEGALRDQGFEVLSAAAPEDPARLAACIRGARPDAIFNLAESVAGEARLESAVAWIYELLRVPYTGSGPAALTLAGDKSVAQALLRGHGVPVPGGVVLARGDEPFDGLRFPVIVKPSREDASHGLDAGSVARDGAAARARARLVIERYAQPALVEEFLAGREFNVSILAGEGERDGETEVLPIREIDFSGFPAGRDPMITYDAKWVPESAEYRGSMGVPARNLGPALRSRIEAVALAAWRVLGLRDYGRVDLRLDAGSEPRVLDVNPNPDLSPGAGFASAAALQGISYDRLVARIARNALARGDRAPRPPSR